jgi:hypothetical protein
MICKPPRLASCELTDTAARRLDQCAVSPGGIIVRREKQT